MHVVIFRNFTVIFLWYIFEVTISFILAPSASLASPSLHPLARFADMDRDLDTAHPHGDAPAVYDTSRVEEPGKPTCTGGRMFEMLDFHRCMPKKMRHLINNDLVFQWGQTTFLPLFNSINI